MTYYEQQLRRIQEDFYCADPVYERVAHAKHLVDHCFSEALSCNTLASAACFSRFHFMRIFKNTYGRTFNQYLTEVRIEKAKELLLRDCRVAEVCTAVGFESISSFTTLFRKLTGTTPAVFKKKRRGAHHPILRFATGHKKPCFIK